MQINILGTRGEIQASDPKHLMHSGVLIDEMILLDIGEKTFLKYNPKYIFITHLHPDHAFFIAPGEEIITRATVFAPERSGKLKKLKVISGTIEVEGYRITPVPVTHSLKVKSVAYLIEKDHKRIFYTGDIASMNEKYFKRSKTLDLVITEASFLRKGGLIRKNKEGKIFGHNGVPDLVSLFEKFTRRIVFTHFGTWFVKDISSGIHKIKSMERKDLKLVIAVDGWKFEI